MGFTSTDSNNCSLKILHKKDFRHGLMLHVTLQCEMAPFQVSEHSYLLLHLVPSLFGLLTWNVVHAGIERTRVLIPLCWLFKQSRKWGVCWKRPQQASYFLLWFKYRQVGQRHVRGVQVSNGMVAIHLAILLSCGQQKWSCFIWLFLEVFFFF